jgi:hypothetical protein
MNRDFFPFDYTAGEIFLTDKGFNLEGTALSSRVKFVYNTQWEGRDELTGLPTENQQQNVLKFLQSDISHVVYYNS